MDTGEPGGPNKTKFMHHCGYLVWDWLPINTHEWKKKTNAPHISFVSNRDKTLIWKDVLVHFTLQTDGYDDIIDGVRKMDPWPIYFGFWCLMSNTTKLD